MPAAIVRAGHDGTNVLHLGASNSAPVGGTTQLEADVDNHALTVHNTNGGDAAGALRALSSAPHKPAIVAETDNDETFAIAGVSSGPGFGDAGQFGMGNGTGVQGLSHGGTGVEGMSHSGLGVRGQSQTGIGAEFHSVHNHGLTAHSDIVTAAFVEGVSGLDGTGSTGFGVLGWSPEGAGVVGIGSIVRGLGQVPEVAPGVIGIAPGEAAAVRCVSGQAGATEEGPNTDPVHPLSDGGLALDVVGTARFTTAGNDAVAFGQNSRFVANPAVTALSHISLTLHGDPGPRQLKWVERSPASGFTVHFAGGPPGQRPEVAFSYVIVEPAT
ncbi:MAG TPA: hypothetical protein VF365_06945 [Candidatus Limnocylindria bacterium]